MGERIQRSLISVEETARLLGQQVDELRAVVDHSDHSDYQLAPFLLTGDRPLFQKHVPIHDFYNPEPMLAGQDVSESRFVFGIRESLKEDASSGLYFGIDRVRRTRCVAKLSRPGTLDAIQAQRSVQREAELMTMLSMDRAIADSIVHVDDIQIAASNEFGEPLLTVVNIQEYMSPEDGWFPLSQADLEVFDDMSVDDLLEVFGNIAAVVDHTARTYGVFHNDLHNILINRATGQIKFHDYSNATGVYDEDILLGTREFSSPEWFQFMMGNTKREPGMPSEVYSLAVVFYYLMTRGQVSFIPNDFEFRAHYRDDDHNYFLTYCMPEARSLLDQSPYPLSKGQKDRIYRVTEEGLAYYTGDRHQTATDLYEDFARAIHPMS